MSRHFEVVIVGQGVAGLSCGLGLASDVSAASVVVDRNPVGSRMYKGDFLQPGTLRFLDRYGIVERLESCGGVRISALDCLDADGRLLGALDYSTLPGGFNYGMVHDYSSICSCLARQLECKGLRFEHGNIRELVFGADGRATGVAVSHKGSRKQLEARLVVAAGGANSRLGENAWPRRRTFRYGHSFVGFEFRSSTTNNRILQYITRYGARLLYPLPRRRWRLYVQIDRSEAGAARSFTNEDWLERLRRSTPGLFAYLEPDQHLGKAQVFHADQSTIDRMAVPGAVFVGDAAHTMHPMAGQGMNAAINDGAALEPVLAELGLSRDDEFDDALANFDRIRREELRKISHMSHRMSTLCTGSSRTSNYVARMTLRLHRSNATLTRAIARRVAGLENERLSKKSWMRAVG